MITAISLGWLLLAVFVLIWAIRSWTGKERWGLYVFIPTVLGMAAATWLMLQSLLGVATEDLSSLSEFTFLFAAGEDPVYLLALPAGAAEPRFYKVPADAMSAMNKKAMEEAGMKAGKGVLMRGQFSDGVFKFAEALPPTQK